MARTSQAMTAVYRRPGDSESRGISGLCDTLGFGIWDLESEFRQSPSGDRGSQSVVDAIGRPRPGGAPVADDEIGLGIHRAATHVNHARLAHERLAFAQRQLEAILAGLHLEGVAPRPVGRRTLPFESREVDELHDAAVDRDGTLRAANASADDPPRLR